jgi:hypothetical protein
VQLWAVHQGGGGLLGTGCLADDPADRGDQLVEGAAGTTTSTAGAVTSTVSEARTL